MKNFIKLSVVAMMLISMSCSNEPITEAINGSQDVDNLSRTPQHSVPIFENPTGPLGDLVEVVGASSKLKRSANDISVKFKTEGLIPGNAYTLWWVIFGETSGPPILVTHADGLVVNPSGKGNFSAHISVGAIFNNPLTAEVHLALRTHGPVQPEFMPAQIETIDGGCTSGFASGPDLYPDSDEVGYCANIQVAIHPSN